MKRIKAWTFQPELGTDEVGGGGGGGGTVPVSIRLVIPAIDCRDANAVRLAHIA